MRFAIQIELYSQINWGATPRRDEKVVEKNTSGKKKLDQEIPRKKTHLKINSTR